MNETLEKVLMILTNIFIIYLIGYTIYLLVSTIKGTLTLMKYRQQKKLNNRLQHEFFVPVSIILVTHNNEERIEKKIESLLNLSYKLYEIIIVDDGSEDKTTDIIVGKYNLKKVNRPIRKILKTKETKSIFETNDEKVKITLIKKENDGKADALNAGINAAEYPYITCIDGNFNLQKDALENLVRPVLEDDNVIISTGDSQIGKLLSLEKKKKYVFPKKILSKLEALEYNQKYFIKNEYQGDLIALPSLALLKKDIVMSVLGFDQDSRGENFEIIRKIKAYESIQKEKNVVKNVYDITCFLESQESIKDLITKRHQLKKGLKKSLKKYQNIKLKKNTMISSVCYFLYEKFFRFIAVIGILSTIITCIYNRMDWKLLTFFFLSYILFCSCLTLCAFTTKLWQEDIKISPQNLIIAIISSILENTLLKIILFIS